MEQNKYDTAIRLTPPYALCFHLTPFVRNLAEIVTAKVIWFRRGVNVVS